MALAQITETKKVQEVLKALSFKVEKEHAFTKDGKKIPGMVVVRQDTRTPLSWVGETYGLVPHSVVLEPMLEALGDDFVLQRTVIEREGRRVMIEFRSRQELSIVKGDNLQLRGTYVNSMDRTQSFNFMAGAFRQLCSNGSGVFLDGFKLNIRETHTKNIQKTVDAIDFKQNLGKVLVSFKEAVNTLKGLVGKKVGDEKKAADLVEKFVGKKSASEILGLWGTGRGQNGEKDAYNLFNAVSQHMTDREASALLPVAATVRTYKKTTAMLQTLIALK